MIVKIRLKHVRGNLTGDGTGYSLPITRHYRTMRKNCNCIKTTLDHRLFEYAFAILDLGTKLYNST
ncbi:MAG: hypothetical protein KIY10_05970 [Thermoplasmata archaeon]|jgi:transposase|nr:hypothetical protein [Candidatus Sysuiplasma jiujiangense]MBX8639688.1 hypothetical protein [Candidatus Sysuiplasma jiujiangense]MBX8642106.1 hypothetical protein [Candidatus Sysuiplasma jiujiangense]